MSNKQTGDAGELEIIKIISCPNCNKKLMLLPPGYPMYDIQCTGCTFRAQVKTNSSKPKKSILGAGYDIYEKVLKAGFLPPPLLLYFCWKETNGLHKEIWFFPFIAKGNIQKYTLSEKARRAGYKMFRYINLDKIPRMQLYSSLDPIE